MTLFMTASTSFALNSYNYVFINCNDMYMVSASVVLIWIVIPLIVGAMITSSYQQLHLIVLQIWMEKDDDISKDDGFKYNDDVEENGERGESEEEDEIKTAMVEESILRKIMPWNFLKRLSIFSDPADEERSSDTESENQSPTPSLSSSLFNSHADNEEEKEPESLLGKVIRRMSVQSVDVKDRIKTGIENQKYLSPSNIFNEKQNRADEMKALPSYSKRRFSIQPPTASDNESYKNHDDLRNLRARKQSSFSEHNKIQDMENTVRGVSSDSTVCNTSLQTIDIEKSTNPTTSVMDKQSPLLLNSGSTDNEINFTLHPPSRNLSTRKSSIQFALNGILSTISPNSRSNVTDKLAKVNIKQKEEEIKIGNRTRKGCMFPPPHKEDFPSIEEEDAIIKADKIIADKINQQLMLQEQQTKENAYEGRRRFSLQPLPNCNNFDIDGRKKNDSVEDIAEEVDLKLIGSATYAKRYNSSINDVNYVELSSLNGSTLAERNGTSKKLKTFNIDQQVQVAKKSSDIKSSQSFNNTQRSPRVKESDRYRRMALQNATKSTILNPSTTPPDDKRESLKVKEKETEEEERDNNGKNLKSQMLPIIDNTVDVNSKSTDESHGPFSHQNTTTSKKVTSFSGSMSVKRTNAIEKIDNGCKHMDYLPVNRDVMKSVVNENNKKKSPDHTFSYKTLIQFLIFNEDIIGFMIFEIKITWNKVLIFIIILIPITSRDISTKYIFKTFYEIKYFLKK